jgi:nitrogen fixation/metabolism regulation signal transduction histidine kinase
LWTPRRSRRTIAGLLALTGALALILALVRGMSRPLDELVHATRGLAIGELERRVKPSGPRELQELGAAFNVMGEDLTGARRRIEDERRRLAVTIDSLHLRATAPGRLKA